MLVIDPNKAKLYKPYPRASKENKEGRKLAID